MATRTIPNRSQTQNAIEAGGGILRLEPCWVPRTFMIPGCRLKLHPDDLYAPGGHRGGINERWFSSTTHASNGPGTPDDEGLSYVRRPDGSRMLFKALVDEAGDLVRGSPVMEREGDWNLLCKFFGPDFRFGRGTLAHPTSGHVLSFAGSEKRNAARKVSCLVTP